MVISRWILFNCPIVFEQFGYKTVHWLISWPLTILFNGYFSSWFLSDIWYPNITCIGGGCGCTWNICRGWIWFIIFGYTWNGYLANCIGFIWIRWFLLFRLNFLRLRLLLLDMLLDLNRFLSIWLRVTNRW